MSDFIFPWKNLKPLLRHTSDSLDDLLRSSKSPNRTLVVLFVSLIAIWHVYVPVHELLHVAGCLVTGGSVAELALKPQYGGTLLQHVFPFIKPESDYGGQLTGFTTPNYWAYAVVDFLPFVLSLFGVALMEAGRVRRSAVAFSAAVILIYVPFISIPGDYYEAVSLVTTQIAAHINPGVDAEILLSDDVFKLVGQLRESGNLNAATGALLALGVAGAIFLVLFTITLQFRVARALFRRDVRRAAPEAVTSAAG